MRSRIISPKFWKNEALSELSPHTRLLFIGLWTLADRSGRLEDRPKRIGAEVFPYEQDLDINGMLEQLCCKSLIFRYRIKESSCIQIPKWFTYQHPHPKEPESVLPAIPVDLADFKGCRDFSVASRDFSMTSRDFSGTDPSVSSVPSVSSSGVTPTAKDAVGVTRTKATRRRVFTVNGNWPEWKTAAWSALLREDPKRHYCAGAREQFGRRVETEEQAAWLMDTHKRQVERTEPAYWPGFGKWLAGALDLMGAGLSVEEAAAPTSAAVVRPQRQQTFSEVKQQQQDEMFSRMIEYDMERNHDVPKS